MDNDIFGQKSVLKELGINSEYIRSIKHSWERSHYRAIFNWISKHESGVDSSNLEKIKGLLESFYLLCNIKALDKALKILQIRLKTPTNQQLDEQLRLWGYYQEVLGCYNSLIGNVSYDFDIILLSMSGVIHEFLGNQEKAIEYYELTLEKAKNNQDDFSSALASMSLSSNYFVQGKYQEALNLTDIALAESNNLSNDKIKVLIFRNIGDKYSSLGKYDKAIEFHNKSLELAKLSQVDWLKVHALRGLGYFYFDLGNYEESIKYHSQSLEISIQNKDYQAISEVQSDIGDIYNILSDYKKSIFYQENALKTAQYISYTRGEIHCLIKLGNAYEAIEEYAKAIDCYQQSLTFAIAAKNPLDKLKSARNLGKIYEICHNYAESAKYYKISLSISNKLGNPAEKIIDLTGLGRAYLYLGDRDNFLAYYTEITTLPMEHFDNEYLKLRHLWSIFEQLLKISEDMKNIGTDILFDQTFFLDLFKSLG
jgi:tetratricopeptide (TPR) repeat protein